jgi:transposase
MWMPADLALAGEFGSGQALMDDQIRLLEPLTAPAKPGGRPRSTDMRNLLSGLFYLERTGCQWRHLPPPPAFPPWPTVYGSMRTFLRDGVWESIRHQFVVMLHEGTGRDASPTAALIDTQSVKTTESGGPCGWDAAKRLNGRKRHDMMDAAGLILLAHTPAYVPTATGHNTSSRRCCTASGCGYGRMGSCHGTHPTRLHSGRLRRAPQRSGVSPRSFPLTGGHSLNIQNM